MELKIDRGILSPRSCSIPENWIKRWQFLSDYLEETQQTEVTWNYTGIEEVKVWRDLNIAMDAEEKSYTHPSISLTRDRVKKLLVPKSLAVPKKYRHRRPLILQSAVDRIAQFMNSVDDEYLLHTVIDRKMSQERRRVLYHQLGRALLSSGERVSSSDHGFESYKQTVESLYYPSDLEETDDVLVAVRDVLDKTPIFRLFGIVRTAWNNNVDREDEFFSINWSDMRDMVLITSLPDYKALKTLDCTTERQKQLVRHTIYFCKHNIKRGIQRMNSLRLMAGLPLSIESLDPFTSRTASVLSHREAYIGEADVNNSYLLAAIDVQLDVCHSSLIPSIAANHLGLDAFFRGRVMNDAPLTCSIAQNIRRICSQREYKMVDSLYVVEQQVDSFYLQVLAKCLKLLITYMGGKEVTILKVRRAEVTLNDVRSLLSDVIILQSLNRSLR